VSKIGLDEGDRCVYCGAILRLPPTCCQEALSDFEEEYFPNDEDDIYGAEDEYCNECYLEKHLCRCDDEWCEDCKRSFEYCRCHELFYD
jgi:hypothetical protein